MCAPRLNTFGAGPAFGPPSGLLSRPALLGHSAPPMGVNASGEAFRQLAAASRGYAARRLDISRACANQVGGAGGALGLSLVNVQWLTPSPKLACKVAVVFEASAGEGFATVDSANVWQLQPLIFIKDANRYSPGQLVFRDPTNPLIALSRPLPDAYEIDTTVERVKGSVYLNGVDDASHPRGTWYATASWEPRVPMADDERAELFALCDVSTSGSPKAIQGSSA